MACRTQTKRVTLARVAKESKVSVTTASLILSGRPTGLSQFQQQTIERVRRVADELGYRANLFASSLLATRSSFFAMVMQGSSHGIARAWNDSICEAELLRGATETTTTDEVFPVVVTAGAEPDEVKVRSIERVMAGGVFGTIVRSPSIALEASIRKNIERGYPTVAVFPDPFQDWPQNAIKVDHVGLGSTAGRLLAAQGARRWLLVRDAQFQACQALRSQGCQKIAVQANAESCAWELPASIEDAQASELLLDQIRQFRPDGIFGMTLRASVSSLRACAQLNMKAGPDYALVGSGCAFWYHSPDSRITSLDASWFDAGATAIRQLIAMAEAGENRFDSIVLRPRILEGNTCRVPDEFKD